MFLVAAGSLTRIPSKSLLDRTWHPSLHVAVSPNAKSSMSSSSTLAAGNML